MPLYDVTVGPVVPPRPHTYCSTEWTRYTGALEARVAWLEGRMGMQQTIASVHHENATDSAEALVELVGLLARGLGKVAGKARARKSPPAPRPTRRVPAPAAASIDPAAPLDTLLEALANPLGTPVSLSDEPATERSTPKPDFSVDGSGVASDSGQPRP